jgi:hypothetical protein
VPHAHGGRGVATIVKRAGPALPAITQKRGFKSLQKADPSLFLELNLESSRDPEPFEDSQQSSTQLDWSSRKERRV